MLGALVTLPPGESAEALGLETFEPGYGRLHARPADLVAYASAHPELEIEVAPPLHSLLDKAAQWIRTNEARERFGLDGSGVLVGVADTGLDVTLPDFLDPKTGKSRVAWLLDLSLPPAGLYPALEQKFCVRGTNGACQYGAVLQGKDIDALIANPAKAGIPIDEYGHGTHVTSIAAGNGGPAAQFVGAAPAAQIVFARIVRTRYDSSYTIQPDDILTGASFIFDRASSMKLPVAVNLSVGTDFGPHDGSLSWEKVLAGYVGEKAPGHAFAVAAGNSGSIVISPIHQVVQVPSGGGVVSVPIPTSGSSDGTVQVWVRFTPGSTLSVGLDGPDGTWIAPVADGQTGNKSTARYAASVANGSTATQISGAPIPSGSPGAVVVWDASSGTHGWPTGTYAVTLQGSGTADLWLSTSVTKADGSSVGFSYGVREGTVDLPATQPGLISVGCTVNRATWTSIDDAGWSLTTTPGLDRRGGLPLDGGMMPFVSGEVCWFSAAGPTVTGVPKPEISAPGAFVVGAMSSLAAPGSPDSIFTSSQCYSKGGEVDPLCFQVDSEHAVAEGTSMSTPMVAGAIALLLQRDPTLTQSEIIPILQGGAHFFRTGEIEFEDQGGPGELDVVGSLEVMDLMRTPAAVLPSAARSWLTLSTDYVLADGSTPTVVIVELRAADGHPADLFEPSRLEPRVSVNGAAYLPTPSLVRHGPGVWFYSVQPPAGLGGQAMTFGATFDGHPIVQPRTVPIATDTWTADYRSTAGGSGGCSVAPAGVTGDEAGGWIVWVSGLALFGARRRVGAAGCSQRFSPATPTVNPCGSGTASFGSNGENGSPVLVPTKSTLATPSRSTTVPCASVPRSAPAMATAPFSRPASSTFTAAQRIFACSSHSTSNRRLAPLGAARQSTSM